MCVSEHLLWANENIINTKLSYSYFSYALKKTQFNAPSNTLNSEIYMIPVLNSIDTSFWGG